MQPPIELKFNSIIPHDRVFVNGRESRSDAGISWGIWDVNNYAMRWSNLFLVSHPSIKNFSEWTFRKEGSGLIPLKVFLNEADKLVKVIF